MFDIGLLARRLAGVTGWLRAQPGAARLPISYFGASNGAAAALWAAAEPGTGIAAMVSRGGRPDLASPRLGSVRASLTHPGINASQARARLKCRGDHDDAVMFVVTAPATLAARSSRAEADSRGFAPDLRPGP